MFEPLTQAPEADPWDSDIQQQNLSAFYSHCVEILPCALDPLLIIGQNLEVPPDQIRAAIADVVCKHLERSDVLQT